MGYLATVTSAIVTFPSNNYLTGTITAEVQGVIATATLSHTKQPCQNLANGATLSGLSGAEGSLRCYAINLPVGATNLDVQSWGGSGDCDLIVIFHRPDFDLYTSENDANQEQITVTSPNSGMWYIGLDGWESYSGLNLNVSYVGLPAPVANFTASALTGIAPLKVTFTDQSMGGTSSWAWDFGDGTASNVPNPVHIYSDPGNYTVTLTVTGPGGTDIETKTGYIVVSQVKAMPWVQLLLLKKG